MKFLLLVAFLAIVVFFMRSSSSRRKPAATESEDMTRCAHCGLHFPRAESVTDGGRDYCCEDHQRLGVRP